ncbi:hypothetical protein B0H19DRAFT_1068842 [Mycena capillaripes]|nr:hypothetical protein B0H19DRAFT_1068842 [Mycena capillaripes]
MGVTYCGSSVQFSRGVWKAISEAAVKLKELDVCIGSAEEDAWHSLRRPASPICTWIRMSDAHGWDCQSHPCAVRALAKSPRLTLPSGRIVPYLPMCCEPCGFTFRSAHPRLKYLLLANSFLLPEVDFLALHPALECLYLRTEQPLVFSPSTQLRLLSISQITLVVSPTAVSSHLRLTHLWLRDIPHLSGAMVVEAAHAVSGTLRWLESDNFDEEAYSILLEDILVLLRSAPALDELGILGYPTYYPPPPNWTAKDLVGWDVTPQPMVPFIEQRSGKSVGTTVQAASESFGVPDGVHVQRAAHIGALANAATRGPEWSWPQPRQVVLVPEAVIWLELILGYGSRLSLKVKIIRRSTKILALTAPITIAKTEIPMIQSASDLSSPFRHPAKPHCRLHGIQRTKPDSHLHGFQRTKPGMTIRKR